jgi:hypothetical protein
VATGAGFVTGVLLDDMAFKANSVYLFAQKWWGADMFSSGLWAAVTVDPQTSRVLSSIEAWTDHSLSFYCGKKEAEKGEAFYIFYVSGSITAFWY